MLIQPPSNVQDFPGLIQWLAEEYHGGTVSAIASRLGVSVATPAFWRRGLVLPNVDNMERISRAYGIDFALVRELAWRTQQTKRRPPMPSITGASEAAPLPVVDQAPVVAQGLPATPSIETIPQKLDTLSNGMSLIRHWPPHLLEMIRPLTQDVAWTIRQQMLRDRWGLGNLRTAA